LYGDLREGCITRRKPYGDFREGCGLLRKSYGDLREGCGLLRKSYGNFREGCGLRGGNAASEQSAVNARREGLVMCGSTATICIMKQA
jgi:hypothetical protein